MKRFLLLIPFLILSKSSFTQSYNIQWSENKKDKRIVTPDAVIKQNNDYLVIGEAFGKNIKKMKFSKLDSSLNIIDFAKKKDWKNKNLNISKLRYLTHDISNESSFIYFKKEHKDKSKKGYKIFRANLSQDLKFVGEPVNVMDIVEDKSDLKKSLFTNYNNDVSILKSKNEAFRLFYNLVVKKTTVEVHCEMYDKSMKKLWSKNVDLKLEVKNFKKYFVTLTNKGNLFVSYNEITEKGFFGGTKNYVNKLILVNNQGKDIKYINLDFNDYYIEDYFIDFSNETGKLNLVGFYSNKKNRRKLNGILSAFVDEEKGIVENENETRFSDKEYELFYKEAKAKKKSKKDKGVDNTYFIEDVHAMPDGGTIYITEKFEVRVYERSNGRRTYYVSNFLCGDIVVMKVNIKGEIEWNKVLPRKMTFTLNGSYSSNYYLYRDDIMVGPFLSNSFRVDGNVYLVYNDGNKNIKFQADSDENDEEEEEGDDKNSKNKKKVKKNKVDKKNGGNIAKASTVLKIMDKDGVKKSDVIFDGKEEKTIFLTHEINRIDDYNYMLSTQKAKKKKIGIFSVKKDPNYKPFVAKDLENEAKKDSNNQTMNVIYREKDTVISYDTIEGKVTEVKNVVEKEVVKKVEVEAIEKPKPKVIYTPAAVSPGRRATSEEQDFFDRLRKEAQEKQ
jgi:hypothetical protein